MWKITWLIFLCSFTIKTHGQKPVLKIPAFTFYTLNHQLFTNVDIVKGKKSLILFFDITCEHCQHAITQFNYHITELSNTDIYLVSLDRKDGIIHFLKQYGPRLYNAKNVLILQDYRNEFIRDFGPRKYPSMFLYSEKQELLLYDDNEQNIVRFLKLIHNK